MSVFFAKIIRLLRKLFNDLSLTRTRFGRRLLSYRTGTCAIFTTSQKQYNYQTSPAVVYVALLVEITKIVQYSRVLEGLLFTC